MNSVLPRHFLWQNNASKLLLAIMESRHDSENAERILRNINAKQLVAVIEQAYTKVGFDPGLFFYFYWSLLPISGSTFSGGGGHLWRDDCSKQPGIEGLFSSISILFGSLSEINGLSDFGIQIRRDSVKNLKFWVRKSQDLVFNLKYQIRKSLVSCKIPLFFHSSVENLLKC